MSPRGSAPFGRPILMVLGGGLENGGGIGRMVGYVASAWNGQARAPMTVIDTRGPQHRRILWPWFLLRSLFQIVRHAPRQPILHVHLAANSSTWRKLIITRVGRFLGLDYLIHMHDPRYAEFYFGLPQWLRSAVRPMFDNAFGIVVLGTPAANTVTRLFGIPRERIDVIPNGVPGPTRLAQRGARAENTEPHILFLGHLHRRKGVHDLIEALSRPEVAGMPWKATLAGGGPEQAEYVAQAVRLGVRNRISFPGWLPRALVTSLLEAADILVLPSYAEEMSMSLLEGMAHGLCVVCTPVGAQAEVVEDNLSGLVVSPGDVGGIAAALVACLTQPALRRRLGNGAREAYLRSYNILDYPERIAAVYERV